MMNFPQLTKLIAVVALTLPLAVNAEQQVKQPNVLFIAIDDLKPLIGAYGNQQIKTPNIDALANSGAVFSKAYSQYPVCGPSRMSLLTGTRPETNGIMNLKSKIRQVNPDVVTLPQLFKQHGYETAAVGKIFDPRNVESRETDDPQSWSIAYQAPKKSAKGKLHLAVEAIDSAEENFVDGDINKRAKQLLKQVVKNDKPFFLAVGYKKPHLPFVAPKKYFDWYDASSFELASFQQAPTASNASYILNNNGEFLSYYPTPEPGEKLKKYVNGAITETQQRELLQGYYASVSFIDSLIGDLLAELDASGKADNTIIVLWGDHGFHLGDHGLWGKHTTMEQANHVPLIIKVPGQKATIFNKPVGLLDIFPTLTDLANLPAPKILQGDSLSPVIYHKPVDFEAVAISQYKRKGAYGYSLRTERYRYTEWLSKNKKVVYKDLYDMEKDPGETENVIAQQDYQQISEQLAKLLREHSDGLKRL